MDDVVNPFGPSSERPATQSGPYAAYDYQQAAFEEMLDGKGIRFSHLCRLLLTSLVDPIRMAINYLPGPAGYGIRRLVYARKFRSLGKNCILDVGLKINGAANISLGEYTWIDSYTALHSLFGPTKIGKRIHVSPFCVITAGPEGVELEDYVGLSTGVHVYGHTEAPINGRRMSGPMIPWRYKAFRSSRVIIEKDAFLGAYSVVFPGVTIGEGAVIGAHSVVTRDIAPWTICVGAPARVIGTREKIRVPEI